MRKDKKDKYQDFLKNLMFNKANLKDYGFTKFDAEISFDLYKFIIYWKEYDSKEFYIKKNYLDIVPNELGHLSFKEEIIVNNTKAIEFKLQTYEVKRNAKLVASSVGFFGNVLEYEMKPAYAETITDWEGTTNKFIDCLNILNKIEIKK